MIGLHIGLGGIPTLRSPREEGLTSTIPMVRDLGFVKEEGARGLLGLTGLEGKIYPGSGPFRKVKPLLLPVWLYYSARLLFTEVLQLRLDLAQVSRVIFHVLLSIPPMPYIGGRVPGYRT